MKRTFLVLSCLLVLLPCLVAAATLQLPATGETYSYAAGDDADLQVGVAWPNPRFTDNNNGTVTDNLTGLVWLKNAYCKEITPYGFGTLRWADALTRVKSLASGTCGLTDSSTDGQWRLPNRKELQSLLAHSRRSPALPDGHPFSDVQADDYWSSSTYAGNPDEAWHISLGDGSMYYSNKSYNSYNVLPVRDWYATASLDVTVIGSGTVTSSPAGISCISGTCSSTFLQGASATLTAVPDAGAIFTGWSGGGCSGTGPCVVNLTDNTSVTATFTTLELLLSENFDSVTPPELPSGWTSIIDNGVGNWFTNVNTSNPIGKAAHSGPNLAFFNSHSVSPGSATSLISPAFSLAATSDNTISFWMYRDSEYPTNPDRVDVYINTSAELAGAYRIATAIRPIGLSPPVAAVGWYKYSFAIPGGFNGTTNYLILVGISGYGNDVHIDDVRVQGIQHSPGILTLSLLTRSSDGSTYGGGSVTGNGISCQSQDGATSGTCSGQYDFGSNITLTATEDNSIFEGWTGCSSYDQKVCSVTMDGSKSVTAYFVLVGKARIRTVGYNTLQAALTAAAPASITLIRARRDTLFDEGELLINKPIVLSGGYAIDYSGQTGYSELDGTLTIGSGSLVVDRIVVK